MLPPELSLLEFHVLLALADGPRYGLAIKTAVDEESRGHRDAARRVALPVLARLMADGLVREAQPEEAPAPHPGLERRYYALTRSGRHAWPPKRGASGTARASPKSASASRRRGREARVLCRLVRLFPAPFRAEFGAEISAADRRGMTMSARRQGAWSQRRYAASTGSISCGSVPRAVRSRP